MARLECGSFFYSRMKGGVVLTGSRSRLDPGPVITNKLREHLMARMIAGLRTQICFLSRRGTPVCSCFGNVALFSPPFQVDLIDFSCQLWRACMIHVLEVSLFLVFLSKVSQSLLASITNVPLA